MNLKAAGLGSAERVSVRDLDALNAILDNEVPALRRLAAPLDFGAMLRDGFAK
jgi:hypothetical protein